MSNSAFSQSQTPNASETVNGSVEEATQAQADAGIDTGETGARLFVPPSKILAMIPEGVDTQVFTANGTYTVPAGATMLYVEGWGGGGSGGAARSNSGSAQAGGGGGGARRAAWIPVSLLGGAPTVAVTVGLGGAAINLADSVSTVATNGNAGANTTFGAFLVANGGAGGTASAANETNAPGGAGGTFTTGAGLPLYGENGGLGGNGSSVGSGSAGNGANAVYSGGGGGGAASDSSSGSSPEGSGGTSTYAGAGGAGRAEYQGGPNPIQAVDGANYGGGGGGVSLQSIGTSRQLISGAGGNGRLVVVAF